LTHAEPDTALRNRIILLFAVSGFAGAANLRMLDSALPGIAAEFDVTLGQAAQVGTVYALAYGGMQIFLGAVGDRIGKYRLMQYLCMACFVTTAAGAFATTMPGLLSSRFAAGASASAVIPMAIAWIGDNVAFERRQSILATFMSGTVLGLVFGQVLGGAFAEWASWRAAPAIVAVVYAASAAGLFVFARRNPSIHDARAGKASLGTTVRNLKRVLARPWSRKVLLAATLEGFAIFGCTPLIGILLVSRFEVGLDVVGVVLAVYAGGVILNSYLVARVAARIGMARHFQFAVLCTLTGMAILVLSGQFWLMPVAVLLLGLGAAGIHNSLQTFGSQLLPEARATGFSLFATCFFLSQSLGVAVYGAAIDAFSVEAPFILAACIVVALGVWFPRLIDAQSPAVQSPAGERSREAAAE